MNGKRNGLIIVIAVSFVFVIVSGIGTASCRFLGKVDSPPPPPTPSATQVISNSNSNSVNSYPSTPSPTQNSNKKTPSPSPTQIPVTPTPTPAPTPAENIADRIRSQMDLANIVYDPPATINLEESKVITVLLGPNKSVVELKEKITELTNEKRDVQSDKLQWYGYMQADMTGEEFEITPLTSAKQLVSREGTTQWRWSIKPKKPGKGKLYLSLSALVDDGGIEKPLIIHPFNPKEIEVNVTLYQKTALFFTTVGSHMEWILTGIIGLILPFAFWLWSRARGKTENEPSESKTGSKQAKNKRRKK